ncbi:hypothetical protein ACO0OL_002577 [Hanseniaspora opuntiae]
MDKQDEKISVTPTVNQEKVLGSQKPKKNPVLEFLNQSENLCLRLVDPETSSPIYNLTINENVISLLEKDNESLLSQNDDKPCQVWAFGRSSIKSKFVLKDIPRISNLHFEITLERNCRLYLRDMSTNGTWLNGHQIPHNLKVKLADGDVIGIGYGVLEQVCNFEVDINTGFMAQYRYYFLKQLKNAAGNTGNYYKEVNFKNTSNKRKNVESAEQEDASKKQKCNDDVSAQKDLLPSTSPLNFKQKLKNFVAETAASAQNQLVDVKRVADERMQSMLDNDEEKLYLEHYNAVHNADLKAIQELPVSQRFDFQRLYEILDVTLGKGAFGVVKKCVKKSSKKHYAVKIMKRNKLDEKTKMAFINEIGVLNNIKHKRILNVEHSSWDKTNYYIVSELIEGGDLMDFVGKYGAIEEKATVEIAFQILEGVQYLHSNNIIHRDIKPDNVLIVQDCPVVVKIADFGLSKRGDEFKTFCGTMAYLAPEIIGEIRSRNNLKPKSMRPSYSSKADMWAVGCLIYVILTNHLPFSAPTEESLFDNIRKADYSEIPLLEKMVSSACLQFLRSLICRTVSQRFSAKRALKHEWFEDKRSDAKDVQNSELLVAQDLPLSQLSRKEADKSEKNVNENNDIMDKWKQAPFMDGSSQPWKKIKDPVFSPVINTENTSMTATKNVMPDSKSPDQGIVTSNNEVSISDAKNVEASKDTFKTGFRKFRGRVLSRVSKDTPSENNISNDGIIGLSIRTQKASISDGELSNEKQIDVFDRDFCLGRSKINDYVLLDGTISKLHCAMMMHANSVDGNSGCSLWLYSYSTNHIYVNNVKMKKFTKVKIWPGDLIKLIYNVQGNSKIEIMVNYIATAIDSIPTTKPDGMNSWENNRDLLFNARSYHELKAPESKLVRYKCELFGDTKHTNKHCICSVQTLRKDGNPGAIYPEREPPISMSDEEIEFSKEFLIKSL